MNDLEKSALLKRLQTVEERRMTRNISRGQLLKEAGVAQGTYYNWVHKVRSPQETTIRRLELALERIVLASQEASKRA